MQRTDTEMLDFVLGVMGGIGENAEALHAAYSLGYAGREAIALAMGSKTFEPGEPLPPVGALDLVADEVKCRKDTGSGLDVTLEGDRKAELLRTAALAVLELDELLAKGDSPQEELNLDSIRPLEEERPDDAEPGVCVDAQGLDPIPGEFTLPPTGTVTALGAPCYACNEIDGHEENCPIGIAQAIADETNACANLIRKGDRVRVVRSAPEWEGWVPAMGKLVGNQYIVEERIEAIRTHPATVLVGDWHIPASCCEVVP